MQVQIKTSSLFYTFALFMCLNSFFLSNTDAQVKDETDSKYTFETIDVPGVDFLALTASSDFEDYAGYTKSADGEKTSPLHSLMAFLRPTISPARRTLISMRSAIMATLPGTIRIATVFSTASS